MPRPLNPEQVVAQQLEAYNAKDIDRFIEAWHPEAEYYKHPSTLLAKGRDAIRARHIERFKEPDLFGKLLNRSVYGNMIVDEEIVTRNFPEGKGSVRVLGIYEVTDSLIVKAWFIMSEPKLE